MAEHSVPPAVSPAFFSSSSHVAISGGQFILNNNTVLDQHSEHLKDLYKEVALHAILNAGGRADPVGCYQGTREEIIEAAENWMASGYICDRRIFWLSGPAGAGKSAIVQTLAERCIVRNAAMANFFFFRADATRNHTRPVVATVLYQICALYPDLISYISNIITKDPVVLQHSMRAKFWKLLKEPVDFIRRNQPNLPPIILLIDGLDECDAQPTNEQISLLFLLNDLVTSPDSPFIALVSSRPEAHLRMAFSELGISDASIFLDDHYQPEADISRFAVQELNRIKNHHSLGHILTDDWPRQAEIDTIVAKSSGQFLYAATVMRFIAQSPASPATSMDTVLGLRPIKKNSPFAQIDAIYTHILSQAEDWIAVRDVLASHHFLISLQSSSVRRRKLADLISVLSPAGYTDGDIASCLSSLSAIIRLDTTRWALQLYHASMSDFLHDRSRSGKYFIDLNEAACRLVPKHFQHITDYDSMELSFVIFSHVLHPDESVSNALRTSLPSIQAIDHQETLKMFAIIAQSFMTKLEVLYRKRDRIIIVWRRWFHQNKILVRKKWYAVIIAKLVSIIN